MNFLSILFLLSLSFMSFEQDSDCGVTVPTSYNRKAKTKVCMTPQSDCFLNGMVFSIYDDFGKNVYKSNNVKDCWDETFKGKPLPSGHYFWKISYLNDGREVKKSGKFHML